jgi:hypothetical protein
MSNTIYEGLNYVWFSIHPNILRTPSTLYDIVSQLITDNDYYVLVYLYTCVFVHLQLHSNTVRPFLPPANTSKYPQPAPKCPRL